MLQIDQTADMWAGVETPQRWPRRLRKEQHAQLLEQSEEMLQLEIRIEGASSTRRLILLTRAFFDLSRWLHIVILDSSLY